MTFAAATTSDVVPPGTVALVGGAGLLGTALVDALRAAVRPVFVIDARLPRRAVPCARLDLTSPDAATRLVALWQRHRVVSVVHLAARVDLPARAVGREREAHRRLHVDGTQAVLQALRQHRPTRAVLVSSATVYGAWPDNPVPLEVDQPLRPNRGFSYGEDKAAQEALWAQATDVGGRVVVRPGILYSPGAKSWLTELLRHAPGVLPALGGHRPPLQFVHTDDAAAVVAAAATAPLPAAPAPGGVDPLVLHAGASDWLAFDDVARLLGLRVVDIAPGIVARVAAPLADALAPWMPATLRAPSSVFPGLMHPFVLGMKRTTALWGVRPRHTSADALRAALGR